MEMKLDKLTLTNIADGQLEEQFQQRLQELATNVFADAGAFESSNGKVTAKIKAELVFDFDTTSGAVQVYVRAELAPPKRILIGRPVYRQKDDWYAMQDPLQEPLPFKGPRAVESK